MNWRQNNSLSLNKIQHWWPCFKYQNGHIYWVNLLTTSNCKGETKIIYKEVGNRQWLCLSWLSGRFQFQRSAVQIQSLAKKLNWIFTVNCIEKTKIKKKRPGMAQEDGNCPFFKKRKKNSISKMDVSGCQGKRLTFPFVSSKLIIWQPVKSFKVTHTGMRRPRELSQAI